MNIKDLERMRSDVDIIGQGNIPRPVDTIRQLLVKGEHVFVRLEPGDATRYELLLTPFYPDGSPRAQQSLSCTRMINGAPVGTAVIHRFEEGLDRFHQIILGKELSNGNEWSEMVFRWWFDKLLNR